VPNIVGAAAKAAKAGGKLNTGMEMLFGNVSMNHHFAVRIDKSEYDLGSWATVSGLSVRWAKIEHRTGGRSGALNVFPGEPVYNNIKLARAACSDSPRVQQWLAANNSAPQPLSGAVQLTDWMGFTVVEWRLDAFIPIAWEISGFNAADGKPVIETLELAHTGFLGAE
jgi:phage tail-like protein